MADLAISGSVELEATYVNWTALGFMLIDHGQEGDDIVLMGEWIKPEENDG